MDRLSIGGPCLETIFPSSVAANYIVIMENYDGSRYIYTTLPWFVVILFHLVTRDQALDLPAKLQRAIKSKKIMRSSEIAAYVSTRTQIRRMVDAGKLVALGTGLYADPSLDPFAASIIATARFYPDAVISGITALVVHGLSDERIDKIDVDIPRNCSIRNKLISAHRVPERTILGVIRLSYQGQKIRIYSRERSLCDVYRIDPEGPIFLKALKRYVKTGEIDSATIDYYDGVLSTSVLRSLRQELADE